MLLRLISIILIVLNFTHAKMYQSIDKDKGTFIQEGKIKYFCTNCGMRLPLFYKTNHIHKNHQYCSLHCLYESTKGDIPKDAKVADAAKLNFIDTKKAFYVVGSRKKGTMSVTSKYAFGKKDDAEKFVKKFGGKIVNFEQAYKIVKREFKQENEMIKNKKEKKVYAAGKNVYEKKCKKINVNLYENIATLKATLKEKCKISGDKPIQMAAVYLWDMQRLNKKINVASRIIVPNGAKCAICGMLVGKYPKWVAMIKTQKQNYYFDGVKDMIKFIFSKKKRFENMYVTDYFTTNKLEARRAYYVIGSNVYGPMGKEIIPFNSEEKAIDFKEDHFGMMVLRFHEITEEILEEL